MLKTEKGESNYALIYTFFVLPHKRNDKNQIRLLVKINNTKVQIICING